MKEVQLYQFYFVYLDELPQVCMGGKVEGQTRGVGGKQGSHVGHVGATIYQGLAHSMYYDHLWSTGSPAMVKGEIQYKYESKVNK